MNAANMQIIQSQQETSKIKSQLKEVNSEKTELKKKVESKDARIQQLEKENSDLKE